MSWNELTPNPNITATTPAQASAASPGRDSRPGTRVTSQAPGSEMAPSAGT